MDGSGGVSGGDLKRVWLGNVYIATPTLMCLWEMSLLAQLVHGNFWTAGTMGRLSKIYGVLWLVSSDADLGDAVKRSKVPVSRLAGWGRNR